MPDRETVIVGEYYIDIDFLQIVYNEAKEKILTENRIEVRRIQRRRDERVSEEKEKQTYFANQKLLGILEIIIVLALTLLTGNLVFLVMAIFGAGMIATKKMVVVNAYWWSHGGPEQWKGM